jgi:uncharacterized protein with HEPN domain
MCSTTADDVVRLQHMLDAAREAGAFVRGQDRSDLERNRMLQLALIRLIEVIGEAAGRVSEDTRKQITTIPWPLVIAMRNRLIHGYFDVDVERVWDTVVNDLPPLVAAIEAHLSGERPTPG